MLLAACDRALPRDQDPGALDAGVPEYIDRMMQTPELAEPERLMAGKYFRAADMTHDGRHAWLRITPAKITSWDFRKLATLPARD